MKRSRGRNRRSGGNQQNAFSNPNRHFESVGPDVKIRGSAQQVLEKYLQYARDAQTGGDRILSEAYFQYAEHYQRIVAKQLEARNQQQQQHQNQNQNRNGNGNGPRDERDPRGPERDPRQGPGDDMVSVEDDAGEAEVVPVMTRHEDAEESDSLRVIDADDDADDSEVSAAEPEARGERAQGDRERGNRRGNRKPYRAREDRPSREPAEAASENDGVMKTLARGRRKTATEDSAAGQD